VCAAVGFRGARARACLDQPFIHTHKYMKICYGDPGQKVRHSRNPGRNKQTQSSLAEISTGLASFD